MRKAVVGKEHDNFLFVIKIVFFVSSLQALKMHCLLYRSRGCLVARTLANGRGGHNAPMAGSFVPDLAALGSDIASAM